MSQELPLMRKATAAWLVENTALTFDQIAVFCGLHELEVQGIADGDVASNVVGQNPILSGQLTKEEILRCESDNNQYLKINRSSIDKNTKVKKSVKILSKYKSYLLLVINNQKNIPKDNNINILRYYGIGAQIIKDLNVRNMILLSRSKKKIIGLDGFGLKIKKQIIIK